MPAQSQQQQKLFGLALAFKRGEVPASEVSDEIKDIADRMSEKEIEDFAATKHKGLPKMKEQLRKIVREIMRERAISEIEISKDDMEKLHSDGEVEVDGEKVTFEEGKKRFRQQDGIGKAKYTISYHDGKQKHKDGSDFFGIQIFKNKKDLETFRNALLKKGFVEESVNEASLSWEKYFKGYNEKELKVISKFIFMNPQGIDGVIKMSKHKPKEFKKTIQKAAKAGLHESVNEYIEPQTKKIAYYTGTRPEAVKDFVSKHALNITKLLKYVEKGGLPQRMELVSALAGKTGNPIQKKVIKMFGESVNEAVSKTLKYRSRIGGDIFIEIEEDPAGIFVDVRMKGKNYNALLSTTDIEYPSGHINVTPRVKNIPIKESVGESVNEGPSTEEKRIAMLAVRKQAKYRNVSLEQAIQDQINALEELKRDIKKGKIKK